MSLALLFPGQGAQHPQMLPWLDAQPEVASTLKALNAHLGRDWRDGLDDPDWLHANRVAQLLLTGMGIAAWQVLAPHLPRPAVVAGYSVGELAAFAVAGVFNAATALDLAAARAQAMSDSAADRPAGLMAVQGPHALAEAESVTGLSVAIRIGAERAIVGGPIEALDSVAARWSGIGLRCTRLPIGVASHTPAMAAAAAAFARRRQPRPGRACASAGRADRQHGALGRLHGQHRRARRALRARGRTRYDAGRDVA